MEDADGEFGFVLVDQHADLDLAGGDRLDVDPALGQRGEHVRRDARMALHAHADDADLGDLAVGDDAVEADLAAVFLQQRLRARQVGLRDGEGDVGLPLVAPHVLDDHVDIDAGRRQRAEDMRHRAGLVRYAGQDHLRFGLVVGDAGNQLPFHIQLLLERRHFLFRHDQRAGQIVRRRAVTVGKAAEHLHAHAGLHRQADASGLQHLGADAGELQHFLVRHRLQLARLGDDARVGGIDPVHVGIDVAPVGTDSGRHRHGRGIGPAAAHGGDAPFVRNALEARDHRDLALAHRRQQAFRIDGFDPRLGMGFDSADRQLPAKPAARLHAHALQREREEPAGHLLPARHDDVVFGRIVKRVRLAREIDQPVGLARHGGDDHRHLVARAVGLGRGLPAHDVGDPANALGPGHRSAAEFHHDPGQSRHAPAGAG